MRRVVLLSVAVVWIGAGVVPAVRAETPPSNRSVSYSATLTSPEGPARTIEVAGSGQTLCVDVFDQDRALVDRGCGVATVEEASGVLHVHSEPSSSAATHRVLVVDFQITRESGDVRSMWEMEACVPVADDSCDGPIIIEDASGPATGSLQSRGPHERTNGASHDQQLIGDGRWETRTTAF